MAEIRNYRLVRHLRSDASDFIIRYHKGERTGAGRGLAFWFRPEGASIAEIPMDDRDMPFHFHGRSQDFQKITLQGGITWRVTDPDVLSRRIDFSIDLKSGHHVIDPIEKIYGLIAGAAQHHAAQYLAQTAVTGLLEAGAAPLRDLLDRALKSTAHFRDMGIEVIAVQLADLRPTSELDKALQTPTFEVLQQQADQATFERRALAVEKERAIAENELQNRIELARREKLLIEQEGENAQRQAQEAAAAERIAFESEARRIETIEQAKLDMERAKIDSVEQAKVEMERARIEIYRDLPASVLGGLAAREMARKLTKIEHLNISPDMLTPILANLAKAGTARLEGGGTGRRKS